MVSATSRSPGARSGRSPDGGDPVRTDERRPTDAECVLQILERNGGRVYQTDVVDATDWSKSKVSRVLGEMEGTGEVARFRLGRQKVVCYPQDLPERAEKD